MTARRFQHLRHKLSLRQPDLSVLLEQVHKVHNFSAILRSCDAVGVMTAHAIPPEGGLPLASHTAQGTQKWVGVERHRDCTRAAHALKQQGFTLFAAHLSKQAIDFRHPDYTKPTCFVLGTEKRGISPAMLDLCDQVVSIPMQGMAASLNVSVAAALLLFEAQRQRLQHGLYAHSRLPRDVFDRTLFEWHYPRLARHCRKHGLDYPPLSVEGDVKGAVQGSAGDPFTGTTRNSA